MKIADAVAAILETKKFNQTTLAARIGASQSQVSRWLKGQDPEGPYTEAIRRLHAEAVLGKKSSLIDSFDPDAPDVPADESMTHGAETGVRGIPDGASPQIDVTAGMGGGGLTVISEGVPGKHGMTFAAENIADYWRVPPTILTGMGNVKPTDITFVPCQGDSMSPTLVEGDVVVVDTRHRWPSPDGLYALTDAFGGIIVKRLHVTDDGNDGDRVVMVVSDNPKHEPRRATVNDLRIVGRVLRKFGLVG